MHGTSESHGSAKRLPTKQMRTLDLHSGPHLRVECHRLCGLLAGLWGLMALHRGLPLKALSGLAARIGRGIGCAAQGIQSRPRRTTTAGG